MSSFTFLILLFILNISLSPLTTFSQETTVAQCATRLLPLAPCASFVQGTALSPALSCCDNLNQLYAQQPKCLCMLLNETTLNSLPINTTLALQLPSLCHLKVDILICSGRNVTTSPPGSQMLTNTNSTSHVNSTIAASPMFQTVPRSPNSATGHGSNEGGKLKRSTDFTMVMVAALIISLAT
ncbi:hypothetical protein CsatA_002393 [Cannabis sativa]